MIFFTATGGFYKDLAEGLVLERYRRELAEDEDNELFGIIEPYARGLREYFTYYKEKRKISSHKQ